MPWNPIVAGVDGSPQSARSADLAWRIAQAAGAPYRMVHAVSNPWQDVPAVAQPFDMVKRLDDYLGHVRSHLEQELRPLLPAAALDHLDLEMGRAPLVLAAAASRARAEYLVLGGKHHSTLERWFSGSTAHHLVRTLDLPLLVTGDEAGPLERILVAADLSHAAKPAIKAASRLAKLFGARLRGLHAVEPMPTLADFPGQWYDNELFSRSEHELEAEIWPMFEDPTAEVMVRRGMAAETIAAAAAEWRADLVVVGSHGKGWIDRLLIGSTTERLLNRLPTSLLVVPIHGPAAARQTVERHAALQGAL